MIKVQLNVESDGDFRLNLDTTNIFDCEYKLQYGNGDYDWSFYFHNSESIENKIYYLFDTIKLESTRDWIVEEYKNKKREFLKKIINEGLFSPVNFFSGNQSFIINISEVKHFDQFGNKY